MIKNEDEVLIKFWMHKDFRMCLFCWMVWFDGNNRYRYTPRMKETFYSLCFIVDNW